MAYKSQPTVTRPANATPYTAGDVVGGAFQFTDMPKGVGLLLTSATMAIGATAIPSGMTSFRWHLYSATPPSAIADNVAWDLTTADVPFYLGYIDVGSPADLGTNLFCQVDGVNKAVLSRRSGIWAYMVTNGGFTPAANSEVYTPCLNASDI
jgi:hypothetical protein